MTSSGWTEEAVGTLWDIIRKDGTTHKWHRIWFSEEVDGGMFGDDAVSANYWESIYTNGETMAHMRTYVERREDQNPDETHPFDVCVQTETWKVADGVDSADYEYDYPIDFGAETLEEAWTWATSFAARDRSDVFA